MIDNTPLSKLAKYQEINYDCVVSGISILYNRGLFGLNSPSVGMPVLVHTSIKNFGFGFLQELHNNATFQDKYTSYIAF